MIRWLRHLFSSPNDSNPAFIRMFRNLLIVFLLALIALTITQSGVLTPNPDYVTLAILLGTITITIGLLLFAFLGTLWPAKLILPFVLLLSVIYFTVTENGLHDVSIAAIPVLVFFVSLLFGRKYLISWAVLGVLSIAFIGYFDLAGITPNPVARTTGYNTIAVASLIVIASAGIGWFMVGQYESTIQQITQSEQTQIAANQELKRLHEDLEKNITERTIDLQRRDLELEITGDVAREISIIRDMDTLLNVSVNLLRERFKYYHTGIFLLDERGEFAILRAASSIAAGEMLEQRYKIRADETNALGIAIRTGQAYSSPEISADRMVIRNPLLPETISELILPLRVHSITIGVLDIHSTVSNAFSKRDVQFLQLIADQVAAAIENAQLAERVEETVNELNKSYQAQTRLAWQNLRGNLAFEYDGQQVRPVPHHLPNELLEQLERGKPVVITEKIASAGAHEENENTLLVPLKLLNQVIGVIGVEQSEPDHKWTEEEIAIAEAAANRAAITLENARLLNDSQRRAVKERAISEAAARIGSALNFENVLTITAEELERVLGASEVILQFQTKNEE